MEKERINHPEHYQGKKFEVIDIIDDYNLSFSLGNVIKYVLRAGKKEDAVEDLEKARWYLNREIDDLEDQIEQSTPVKEKPKAYHVTDEYSYKCLMKELEEQGYMFDIKSYASKKPTKLCYELPYGTRDYIYLVGGLDIGWNSDFNTSTPNIYNDERYDLIEYHKEEPKFRARIKEKLNIPLLARDYYFVKASKELKTSKSTKGSNTVQSIFIMTKSEWNKLGINDTNADFEEVEE